MSVYLDHAQIGASVIDSTDGLVEGVFKGFSVLTETVLTSITIDNSGNAVYSGYSKLIGPTLAAGLYIPGDMTSIQVTSGLIQLIGNQNGGG